MIMMNYDDEGDDDDDAGAVLSPCLPLFLHHLPPPIYSHHHAICLSVYHVCALLGYGGFTADKTKATKSFRKSWEADRVGAEISFRFFGSTVKIAIWQRRDGEYVREGGV